MDFRFIEFNDRRYARGADACRVAVIEDGEEDWLWMSKADIGAAVESAIREANIAHYVAMAAESHCRAAAEYERPCVLFRPKVYVDGASWCALYGEDLHTGVAGFGDSPAAAMRDFDKNWIRG